MKITIKATEFELTPSIRTYIEEKLGSLAKLLARLDAEGAAAMRVEVGRNSRHHRHGEVFHAEANLTLPGGMLRAEHEDEDVRVAIDRIRTKLKLEIDKFKTKADPKTKVRRAVKTRKGK